MSPTFADLLGRLYDDTETIAICTQVPGGPFTARRLTVAQARQYELPQGLNTWWSANPVTPGSGRGTAAEVARWAALFTDLDVKPGGVQDHQACHRIVDELALMLGVGPIARTMSGHGWQPLWRMDPDDPATHLDTEEKRATAELLLLRWGVLVGDVARGHEADGVDPVHELSRVLRVPGTVNLKDPAAPVPALPGECGSGGVLTVARLAEVLDFYDSQVDEPSQPAVDHPHDAWDAMNARQRERVQNYLDQVVQGEADEMTEVVSWPEGHTDGHKRGWQKRTADLAFRLARLASSDWTPWGEREAQTAFEMIVPAPIAAAVPMGPIWRGQNRLATKKGPAAMTAGLAKSLEGLATAVGGLYDDVAAVAGASGATGSTGAAPPARYIPGGTFILDQPESIPAVWGEGDQVLWAEGEALVIAGPPGVGKTTLSGQVLRALLAGGEVLGLPVQPRRRVLYLAMDRPRQIARALRRCLRDVPRATLNAQLVVWQGPPQADLAKHPELLLAMAREADADTVLVDSLKDAAVGLSEDEVGAGWNRARQGGLVGGVEVLELHHTVKRGANGAAPKTLADLYGSAWIAAGAGSVVLLHGEAGDPVVEFRHLKQPAAEVGPFKVLHDHDAGLSTVEGAVDLVALARAHGDDGLTAKDAARRMFDVDKPSASQREKARRALTGLTTRGVLEVRAGSKAAGLPDRYTAVHPFTDPFTRPISREPFTDPSRPSRSEHHRRSEPSREPSRPSRAQTFTHAPPPIRGGAGGSPAVQTTKAPPDPAPGRPGGPPVRPPCPACGTPLHNGRECLRCRYAEVPA